MKRCRWLAMVGLVLLSGCTGGPLNVLQTSPDAKQRAAAAEQLGARPVAGEKGKKIVQALSEATCDPDENVRQKSVEALAKLGGTESRQALLAVVRGDNFKQAALHSFEIAEKEGGRGPELFQSLAQAQLDNDQLKQAEGSYTLLLKEADKGAPQQAQRYLYSAKFGYDNLKRRYADKKDQDGVTRVTEQAQKLDEKLKAAEKAGGGPMGGLGGMPGGFPGGMPGGFPGGFPGGMPGGFGGPGGLPINLSP